MSDDRQVERAREWGYTASEGFHASADFFHSLSGSDWDGPTGCADWNQRTLSGHILGEAVWFPRLLLGVTSHQPPYPAELYQGMKRWSPDRQVARLHEAADELRSAIDEAIPAYADEVVDVGWAKVPVWHATYVALMESVYHNWDTRGGRDPESPIVTPWALELASGIHLSAPIVAHHREIAGASGRYLLRVSDGVGPIEIVAEGDSLTVERGEHGPADVTIYLTAEQCVRLIAGRCPLAGPVKRREIRVDGEHALVAGLNRIFGGIANG